MTRVSRNKREKYGQINITWWENTNLAGGEWWGTRLAYWWLTEVISFKTGDDPIKIPIDTVHSGNGKYPEVKPVFTKLRSVDDPTIVSSKSSLMGFPRIGDYDSYHAADFSLSVFGEDDKINVTHSEFYSAGGSARIEWDVEEYQYYVLFQPPQANIGSNENFSITLEGSVPALFIKQPGNALVKQTTTFYTEFYGKTNNTLELELNYITEKELLYQSAQRLLEKYSYGNTTFSLDYFQETIPVTDNKNLVPKSVTVDLNGKRTTNNAFIYNRLDSIPEKPLEVLGSQTHTLNDVQFYHNAFLT